MSDTSDLAAEIAQSVRETVEDQRSNTSRRNVLRGAVAGGSLLAIGGAGSGFALADEDDDDNGNGSSGNESDSSGGMSATFDDTAGTDVDVLNYALSLEHLEYVFYQEALDMFSEDDFANSDALQGLSDEHVEHVYEQAGVIRDHEETHVEVLTQAVQLLGGEPAQECTYNFGMESVEDFLALGQVFENTGVAAYAGAAPYIESPDLASAALSIHSVEARHAAALNVANQESPFPNAFDEAAAQEDVLNAVGDFIESCPESDE